MTGPAPTTTRQLQPNPFPGLRPFDASENHLFFGRDGQSDEILTSLRRNRFVAVVGTSGSGKSSLIRAGLMPLLHGGFMAQTSSRWRIALLRPGNDPIGNLARALNQTDVLRKDDSVDEETGILITETTLRRSGLGLTETVRQAHMPERTNLLVVVDQFEELFRFMRSANSGHAEDDTAFVKLLIEATRQTEVPIFVVITMRSDFIGDCARFRELPETINRGLYLIPVMTRDQRREAVNGPAAVAGTQIEPRLINRLLNDAGENPEQLPLLQHALMRTWAYKKSSPTDGEIDMESYEAIGGMGDALSRHADEAYDELPTQRSRDIAEKIFKALAEKGPDNREVRRPTKVVDLAAIADASHAEVISVIEAFRQSGRSFLMPPPEVKLASQTLIDISHESLIRGWRRLAEWVESESLSAGIYKRVAETAVLYDKGLAGLWHDPDLQVALGWQSKVDPNEAWGRRYHDGFPAAMNFLAESVAARDHALLQKEKQRVRELRRIRVFAAGLAVLLIMASASLVWAMRQTSLARQAEGRARNAEETAKAEAKKAITARNDAVNAREAAEQNRRLAEANADEAERNLDTAQKAEKKASASAAAEKRSAEQARNSASVAQKALSTADERREEAETALNLALENAWKTVTGYESLGDDVKEKSDVLVFYDRILNQAIEAGDTVLKSEHGQDNQKAMLLVVHSRANLPDVRFRQGNKAEAREASDNNVRVAEDRVRENNPLWRVLSSSLLAWTAHARMRLNDHEAAVRDAKRAAEVADEVFDSGSKTDTGRWYLRITYRVAGDVQQNYYDQNPEYGELAVKNYQKAAKVFQQAGNLDPESREKVLSDTARLASLQIKRHQKDKTVNYVEAIDAYKAELKAYEKVAQANPSDKNTRSVASSYADLATLERDAGDLAATRDSISQQIRLLEKLVVDRPKATQADKNLLASAFGNRSWYDVLVGDFEAAIEDAQRGLSYNPSEVWIHTNEAHGYLFSGKIEEARKIYLEHLEKRSFPNTENQKTFAESILEDFDELRRRQTSGLNPLVIADIEEKLRNDSVKGLDFRQMELAYIEKTVRRQIELHQKDKGVSYADALNSYRTRLSAYDLAAQAQTRPKYTRDVVSSYRTLAELQWELRDASAARSASDQQIRLLTPLVNRSNAAQEDKTLLAQAYGARSRYDLFLGEFETAIEDAKKGLSHDDTQVWIHTKEAHGYLFTKQIEMARKIYLNVEYADKRAFPDKDDDVRTFREVTLEDFEEFRTRKVPKVDLRLIDDIEKELRAKSPPQK